MKSVISIPFIAIAILLMVNIGCFKDNTAPNSNAGNDQDVIFPVDFCILNGVAQDRENNIQTILWSKISGPSSFLIEHPDSLSTKVSNLEIGVYQFELTVTDDKGLHGKDIINVTVSQMPNTAPNSNAGNNKYVFFPTNFCTLNGAAQDLENNIQTFLWTKISGPSSFLIEHPDSLSTKVSNLQIGVYQFELTVTDNMGLYGKDTIMVTVTNSNEIILQNQVWSSPWYNQIAIENFYNLIPSGSMFKIFIRRDTNPDWIEVLPYSSNGSNASYEYYIETQPGGSYFFTYGSLYIFYYGMDISDTPDVKILF